MKIKFIAIIIILSVLLVSLLSNRISYYFITGFFDGYDSILEYKINKALEKEQQIKSLQPIALKNFTDKKIVRACIQTPYEPQFYFEEKIATKVNNYNETDDDGMYVLWLFFSDGSIVQVRPYQMNPEKSFIACQKQIITLSFKQEDSHIKFFF
jgi:hypothetical protein